MVKPGISLLLFIFFGALNCVAQEEKHPGGWYALTPSETATASTVSYADELYTIDRLPFISLDDVQKVNLIHSKMRPYQQIEFVFTTEGAKIWEIETEKNAGKKIGFIYNDTLLETLIPCCKVSTGKCSFGFLDEGIDMAKVFENLKKRIEEK